MEITMIRYWGGAYKKYSCTTFKKTTLVSECKGVFIPLQYFQRETFFKSITIRGRSFGLRPVLVRHPGCDSTEVPWKLLRGNRNHLTKKWVKTPARRSSGLWQQSRWGMGASVFIVAHEIFFSDRIICFPTRIQQ